MIDKVFEWLFTAILVLALLPCIVSIVVHTLGPFLLLVAIIAAIFGAFRSYERIRPRGTTSRSGSSSERTRILPGGDH